MTQFIRITDFNDRRSLVLNKDFIQWFRAMSNGTTLIRLSDNSEVVVEESTKTIEAMINSND